MWNPLVVGEMWDEQISKDKMFNVGRIAARTDQSPDCLQTKPTSRFAVRFENGTKTLPFLPKKKIVGGGELGGIKPPISPLTTSSSLSGWSLPLSRSPTLMIITLEWICDSSWNCKHLFWWFYILYINKNDKHNADDDAVIDDKNDGGDDDGRVATKRIE